MTIAWQPYLGSVVEAYTLEIDDGHAGEFRVGLNIALTRVCSIVKFLNFWMSEKFAVIYLNIKKRPNLRVFRQKDANGIANSEDPDLTAPRMLL